jgi:hypothetical protein
MILKGHVGVTFKRPAAGSEMGWEHQDSDIVEQACELELVHCVDVELHRLSNPECKSCDPLSVSGLPRQHPIDFPADLTHEDAFDIASGGFRESKTIDLLEQGLDFENRRIKLF